MTVFKVYNGIIMFNSFMKQKIKTLILLPLFIFYKIFKLLFFREEIVILMYHSISDEDGIGPVRPEVFFAQMKYLKNNGYKFMTVKELRLVMNGESLAEPRSILLTFDDGYKNFITNALPILERNNLPAVVFIHTSRSSDNFSNDFPLMDWNEIRVLNQKGIEIGSHSHSHSDMKKLSRAELQSEIKTSEDIFQKELGHIPKVFAYPGGKHNSQVAEFLRQSGYEAAFTIDEGVVFKKDDQMRLKRIGVSGQTTMLEFKIMLTSAFNWYQKLRRLKVGKLPLFMVVKSGSLKFL